MRIAGLFIVATQSRPLHSRPPPRTTIQRLSFGTKKGLRRESSLTARGPLGLAQASPNTLNTHDTQ